MSETEALRALMQADRWIDRVASQRNHLPEKTELATLEAELRAQPDVARRGELQARIAELEVSLDEELASLREGRRDCASALLPELLARYDAALVRAGTSGAAEVDAGRCDGCRIALSPLDVDRWKAQPSGTFLPCPECGRLLLP